jgi:hypothetical protein
MAEKREDDIDPAVQKAADELKEAYALARLLPRDNEWAQGNIMDVLKKAVITTIAANEKRKLKPTLLIGQN